MAPDGIHEEPGPAARRGAAEQFFSLIVKQAREKKLLSDEHFTVDGTLVEAWAGQKSFQRKDRNKDDHDPLNPPPPDRSRNPTVNWHKEKRSNQTHESRTDPMSRLYKKTRERKQSWVIWDTW